MLNFHFVLIQYRRLFSVPIIAILQQRKGERPSIFEICRQLIFWHFFWSVFPSCHLYCTKCPRWSYLGKKSVPIIGDVCNLGGTALLQVFTDFSRRERLTIYVAIDQKKMGFLLFSAIHPPLHRTEQQPLPGRLKH